MPLKTVFRLLPQWRRLRRLQQLFHPESIVGNFMAMEQMFNSRAVDRADRPAPLASDPRSLPASFRFEGERLDVTSFLRESRTTGLIVLGDGAVHHESYDLGMHERTRHVSWSISKAVVSALFGIAVAEGAIESIADPVDRYLPRYAASGYAGVTLKDVLQMSSGIRFREVHNDWTSDLNRLGRWVALGRPLADFALELEREFEPGTYHRYASIDAQVLALVLMAATGESLTEYTREKLWRRIGTEHDAYWLLDEHGVEFALGGFGATLRDFARFGRLFLNEGQHEGRVVVPPEWVRRSVTPDAPHLEPGPRAMSDHAWGYGFQWWVPEGDAGEYMAVGAYNQFIYVNPAARIVVVKTSANHAYREDEASLFEAKSLALFRAISDSMV